ncbi:amino acid adenylation domain-containing protein [Kordia sp. YSTF-M3]|uniref:Amino acid adenylation domain-containing protein n=1 Tax=Kordia aestuariivivens TaxID=2759037 RepID=A0ABR7QER9_9FLAO|nr:non-ribosomal peptide synthetase [Kordia aestuariivivens]MBC8757077.1 amino acid adenylation domain-containing protein [Kordia aestuariivivens]
MNVYSFLEELKSKEVELNLNDGKLEVQAPEGVLTADLVEKLKSYKEEIIDLLKQLGNEESVSEIPVAAKKEYYPLSFSQNRLWVLDQFDQVSTVFNVAMHYWLNGAIDEKLFAQAFEMLVARHEILRTRFAYKNEQPFQQILANEKEGISFETLDYSNSENPKERAVTKATAVAESTFKLDTDPLLKVAFIKVDHERYFLSLCIHHIISDEWSMHVLVRDVIEIYNGLKSGTNTELTPLRIQFKDYASWELDNIKTENRSKDYWLKKLEGTLPILELASDHIRPAIQTYNGNEVSFQISKQNSQQFHKLLEENGATLFMGVMSLVYAVLYRYSGQNDIILGTPVSGRTHADLEDQIGFYINTLALRQNIHGVSDFTALLNDVKKNILDGYQHQSYPFDLLVDELVVQRDPSRAPLFDVMVVVEDNVKDTITKFDGITIEEARLEKTLSKYDLTFWFKESAEGEIAVHIEYNTDIYGDDRMKRLGDHLGKLLESVVANSTISLDKLPLIEAEERTVLLNNYQGEVVSQATETTLVSLFEAQVNSSGNAEALQYEDTTLSYQELEERSNQFAQYLLAKHNIQKGSIVGIIQDRSENLLISILGILKAGGAYLPIDKNYPSDRIEYMLTDGNVSLVISDSEITNSVENINIVALQEELQNHPTTKPAISLNGEEVAYVIYTSGSTGRPKGVQIKHSSVVNYLDWANENYYGNEANYPSCLFTSLSFDLTVTSLWSGLLRGDVLNIVSSEEDDLTALQKVFTNESIKTVKLTPSHIQVLAGLDISSTNIAVAIVGGEALTANHVSILKGLNPEMKIYNEYGPTETTVGCSVALVEDINAITIGRPIQNTTLYVLDKNHELVPIGVQGELYVGGSGVFKGYIGKEDLTVERTLSNPFGEGTLYKTGDIVSWDSEGNLHYHGRKDDQVKIQGHRIELGELSGILSQSDLVSQFEILTVSDESAASLVVYYIGSEEISSEIKAYFEAQLPAYMVPSYYVGLDEFPLTSNGKLDKSKLPSPQGVSTKTYIAPETETEKLLAEIWSELLLVPQVGKEDNFFELGGNSLKAVQLIGRLKKEASLKISMEAIFRNPILKNLAANATKVHSDEIVSIPKVRTQEDYELSRAQHRTWLQVQRDPKALTFNIFNRYQLKGILNREALEKAFNAVINRHESLRTIITLKGVEPRQVILSNEDYNFSIAYKNASNRAEIIAEFSNHIFDLSKGPLFQVTILENNESDHELLFSMHHIISDEWSEQVLVHDLIRYYNGYVAGDEVSLEALPIQYKDYAAWQSSWVGSDEFKTSGDYWKSHLADAPRIELGSDRPRPEVMTHEGSQNHFRFSKETSDGLKKLCSELGCTLFMGVSSLVYALLYRYTGQSDITLGTPVAGRDHADLENQIGLFLNTLALRAEFSGEDSFKELVAHVKELSIAGFNHQTYPFDLLAEELEVDLAINRSPLFDVVVILQNVELQFIDALQMEGLEIEAANEELKISKGDIRFQFIDREDYIEGSIEYSTDLYDTDRITRMVSHLDNLLLEVISTPDASMKELTYLGEEEQSSTDWFSKSIPEAKPEYIHKSFEKIAALYPEKTALVEASGSTSYKALNSFSNQLIGLLVDLGLSAENAVGVLVPSGKELVGSLLACLKTGITYVPLSNSFSLARMQQAVSETLMQVLITDDESWTEFQSKNIEHKFSHVFVFKASGSSLLGDLGLGNSDLISLEETSLEVYTVNGSGNYELSNHNIESYSKENLSVEYPKDNSSYVFYSSGTTGKSKAIVGNQESISHYINWHKNTFEFNTETRISQIASVTFDASLKDILTSLISGSCLCIPNAKTKENMLLLGTWLSEEKVTILQTVPSLFRLLTNNLQEQNLSLTALKEVVLAGEKLYGRDVELWRSISGHTARMSNLYGLTESTVLKSCYHIPNEELEAGTVLSVGKAIDNSMIAVINDSGLSMWGEIGEVYIKSPYVTKGYLDKELTANLFVQNPLVGNREDLVCKTGDIGRYDSEGNLEILGRIDDQIKLHGVRVELDGIRSSLLNLENIGQVELIVHNDTTVDSLLCYYSGQEYSASELRSLLSANLDRSSIPDYFMHLEEFPLTLNGKVDKRALPKPSELLRGSNYQAPKGAIEESLSTIWSELLSVPQKSIGRTDSFFDLGGSSLKAIQLISRVYKIHEVQLSIGEIFNHSELKGQASLISESKGETYSSIEKVAEQEDYELSHAQRRTWLIEQQIEGVSPFNGMEIYRLKGNLDIDALTKSFTKLIDRHESLRTIITIKDGTPRQKILKNSEVVVDIETVDIRATPEQRNTFVTELRQARFDLSQWPLFRIKVLSYGDNVYDLVFIDHHIISDEWSMQILVHDLVNYYNGFITGKETPLEALPIQYKDYAAWQSSWVGSDEFKASGAYWKSHLADAPRIELASDRPRPEVMSHQGSQHHFSFSKETSERLKELCTELGCTLFMGVSSLVYALLYRYTGQSDITLGTPVAGRDHADLENQIGLFLNALALRAQFSGEDSFKELVAHVKEVSVAGFNHQTYPFDLLAEELEENLAKNRSPLFDVVVILQNVELEFIDALQMEGLDVSTANEELQISKGDLRFQFIDRDDCIEGSIEYSTDLYDADRITRMVSHLDNLLLEVISTPDAAMKELTYLGEEEQSSTNWFEKPIQKVQPQYIHKSFEAIVDLYPKNKAIVFEDESHTYEEINGLSNQIGHLLIDLNIQTEHAVGVLVLSGKELVGSLLSCFKTGSTYVPLSNSFSLSRMQQAVLETSMKVLITDSESWTAFQSKNIEHTLEYVFVFKIANSSLLGDLQLGNSDLIALEKTSLEVYKVNDSGNYELSNHNLDSYSTANLLVEYPIDNSSYVFYSSGTTGKSKAIVGNQESISHYVNWHKNTFGFNTETRISQIASVTFDASLKDILTSLISGSCLCIPNAKTKENMVLLGSWLSEEKITILQTVPSLFRLLTNNLQEQNIALTALKEVVLAGEKLYGRDVELWRSISGHSARMSNLYGLTESTVLKSCYHIPNEELEAGTVLSVGKAIDNSMIAVINDSGLSMWGEIGEVYIKSPYFTKGYLDKELTANLFVQNPLVTDREDLVCKTGDIGRYDSEGNLEILGRIDDQIKLHGVRVELDGIRSSLLNLENIGQVELIVHNDTTVDSLLCYYSGQEYSASELRSLLSANLDRSSIPDYFMHLEEFPLTLNGKVDKRALPKPSDLLKGSNYEAPKGAIEESLSAIWSELLSVPQKSIGRTDSFFDLGGSSLKAIQLISRVYKKHEVQLSIGAIFNHSELQSQASLITESKGESSYESITKVVAQEDYALSHAQRRTWLIEEQIEGVSPFNGMQIYRLEGKLDIDALTKSFTQLIDRHESLRTIITIKDGVPRQKILKNSEVAVDIETIDISADPAQRNQLVTELRQARFDLSQWPLFRIKLLFYGENVYDLVFIDHHIISDEWSMQILVRDLVNYYNGYILGEEVSSEALPIQYKDYAAWQASWVGTDEYNASGAYWKTHLSEAPRIELASDRPRPEVMTNKGSQYHFSFSKEVSNGLKELCTESGCTLFMGVSSLVYALLFRYTGQSDITLGTPVAGRDHADLENQIGLYLNTLALRAKFSGDDNFKELLANVKELSVAGFNHQTYPFDLLAEELEVNLAKNRSPLFDVVVILQNIELEFMDTLEMEGLKVASDTEELMISKGDLRFQFIDREDQIEVSIEYSTDLYDNDRIMRMATDIHNLLSGILKNTTTKIRKLDFLSEIQTKKIAAKRASFADDLSEDY